MQEPPESLRELLLYSANIDLCEMEPESKLIPLPPPWFSQELVISMESWKVE